MYSRSYGSYDPQRPGAQQAVPIAVPQWLPQWQAERATGPHTTAAPLKVQTPEGVRPLFLSQPMVTLMGLGVLVLLIAFPVSDSFMLLYDFNYVFWSGRTVPIAVIVSLVVVLILFLMLSGVIAGQAKNYTIHHLSTLAITFCSLLGVILAFSSLSLFHTEATVMGALRYTHGGAASQGVSRHYNALLTLRKTPSCAKKFSVEECVGYASASPPLYSKYLRSLEEEFHCSGFFYSQPVPQVQQTASPPAIVTPTAKPTPKGNQTANAAPKVNQTAKHAPKDAAAADPVPKANQTAKAAPKDAAAADPVPKANQTAKAAPMDAPPAKAFNFKAAPKIAPAAKAAPKVAPTAKPAPMVAPIAKPVAKVKQTATPAPKASLVDMSFSSSGDTQALCQTNVRLLATKGAAQHTAETERVEELHRASYLPPSLFSPYPHKSSCDGAAARNLTGTALGISTIWWWMAVALFGMSAIMSFAEWVYGQGIK